MTGIPGPTDLGQFRWVEQGILATFQITYEEALLRGLLESPVALPWSELFDADNRAAPVHRDGAARRHLIDLENAEFDDVYVDVADAVAALKEAEPPLDWADLDAAVARLRVSAAAPPPVPPPPG